MTSEVLLAVVVASLLGSVHCVGMCGPFAVMATGSRPLASLSGDGSTGGLATAWWWQRSLNLTSYHLGRLTTYLMIGALVGSLGAAIDGLAGSWGVAAVASKLVGGLMIAMGVWRLWASVTAQHRVVAHSAFWLGWSQRLVQWRKRLPMRTAAGSAFSWGLISTWLPCGWLYVFALAAAGAGGIGPSMLLMAAFWVGTLPLLSALSLGTTALGHSVQRWVQPLAAIVLIAFGGYTMVSRSQVDLSSLQRGKANTKDASGDLVFPVGSKVRAPLDVATLNDLTSQQLPCCEPLAGGDEDASAESCEHCRAVEEAANPSTGEAVSTQAQKRK